MNHEIPINCLNAFPCCNYCSKKQCLNAWHNGSKNHKVCQRLDCFGFWKFKAGDNPDWAKPDFNDSSWQSINLFKDLNDVPGILPKNNIVWFRMRLATDSTLLNKQLVMRIYQSGASEVYLEGKLIHRLGIVSANPDSIKYYSPNRILLSFPIKYNTGQTLAIRFANLPARYPIYSSSSNSQLESWITTIDNAADDYIVRFYRAYSSRINIGIGAGAILCFLYLSFFIFFRARKINLYFSLCNFFFMLTLIFYSISLNNHGPNFGFNIARDACLVLYLFSLLYCIYKIFNKIHIRIQYFFHVISPKL